MSASNYLENYTLDLLLGSGTPATVYISLHTGDPGETGANEVASSNGYAREPSTNNNTNWPAAVSGVKSNGTAITMDTPSGSWGTVSHFGIWDASSGGNFWFGGALAVSKAINSGDTVQFGIGDIDVTAD